MKNTKTAVLATLLSISSLPALAQTMTPTEMSYMYLAPTSTSGAPSNLLDLNHTDIATSMLGDHPAGTGNPGAIKAGSVYPKP